MKTTIEFLDAVKAARGLTSDNQLAIFLGCSRQMIGLYRKGNDFLGDEMSVKIASILGIDAGFVLACVAAQRSKVPEAKKAFEWMAQHLGGIAAALALAAILPTVAMDNRFNAAFSAVQSPALYIMSNYIIIASVGYSISCRFNTPHLFT